MAMPGFGQTHLVWKLAGVQESSGPVSGRTQPACYLKVSHFQTRLQSSTDVLDHIVQPGSDLVLADSVRFWPNGSGLESNRCARIIRPASGLCFPADPDRMRIGSGMFTGSNVRRVDDGPLSFCQGRSSSAKFLFPRLCPPGDRWC